MTIPDKAVEAALDAWSRASGAEWHKLRAALAAAEQAMWEPIEGAPRDGTLFIAFSQDPHTAEGEYDPLSSLVSPCAWHLDAGFCTDEIREPTHWRPLPPSPETKK